MRKAQIGFIIVTILFLLLAIKQWRTVSFHPKIKTIVICVSGIFLAGYFHINNRRYDRRVIENIQRQDEYNILKSKAELIRSQALLNQAKAFKILYPYSNLSDISQEDKEEQTQEQTIFNLIDGMERGVFCGGTRHGKTFAAKQFAHRLLKSGNDVYALDPKYQDIKDPWPEGTRIFGSGDRYDQIKFCFDMVDAMAEKRGRDISNIDSYPPVSIFFDELLVTLDESPDLMDRYVKILCKFAQYKIGIFVISQNDSASDLGFPPGRAKLKNNFDFVARFSFDKVNNERKTFVKFNHEPEFKSHFSEGRECLPFKPVKFRPAVSHGYDDIWVQNDFTHDKKHMETGVKRNTEASVKHLDISHGVKDPYEKQVLNAYVKNVRPTHIFKEIHGEKSYGGNQINKIKEILSQYNLA